MGDFFGIIKTMLDSFSTLFDLLSSFDLSIFEEAFSFIPTELVAVLVSLLTFVIVYRIARFFLNG